MTLHDPARRPCANPARSCGDPDLTLSATLAGSPAGGLACDDAQKRQFDAVQTLPTLRILRATR
jgi:hypothetical protein